MSDGYSMGSDFAIIPAPAQSEGYVELARTRQGRLLRKHILNLGPLIHPETGQTLNLDENWYGQVKRNFDAGVCDTVQVPLADSQNKHDERPDRNTGEVVGLERDGKKVYAIIDARKQAEDFGKTLLGASAFLHMNYKDTKTGQRVGPALLHVAVTNRPYVTGLDPYEDMIAATSDCTDSDVVVLSGDDSQDDDPPAVPGQGDGSQSTSQPGSADGTGDADPPEGSEEPEMPKTKEELLAELKASHGIDIEALQAELAARPAAGPDVAQLTAAITQSLTDAGVLKLSGDSAGTLSLNDVAGAVAELAQTNVKLSGDVTDLKRKNAEAEVDGYISVGRALPKSRSTLVTLALTDRDGMESLLAPADAPFVKLNHQEGGGDPQGEQKQEMDIDAEIARLTGPDAPAGHMFKPPVASANGASRN